MVIQDVFEIRTQIVSMNVYLIGRLLIILKVIRKKNRCLYHFGNICSTTLVTNKLIKFVNNGFENGAYVCSEILDPIKIFVCFS